jgi:hypothetical protein
MTIFAVSRRNDPAGPLLVMSADSADEAVADAEKQEEIGAFMERGYTDSPDGYTAVVANDEQKAHWQASIEDAIKEGLIFTDTDDPDWLTFLRPPEFEPDEDDPDDDDPDEE